MHRTRLLLAQLIVLAILLVVVQYGIEHMRLWDVAWYSAIAHVLGGLWAALFALWGQSILHVPRSRVVCLMAALTFGIAWELFEYSIGATHFPVDTADTAADLVMDFVGGMIGVWVMKYI